MWTVHLTKKYTTRSRQIGDQPMCMQMWTMRIYRFGFVWLIRPNLQNIVNWKLITKHSQLYFWLSSLTRFWDKLFCQKNLTYTYIFNHPLTIPIVNRWHWNFIALVYQFKNSQIDRFFCHKILFYASIGRLFCGLFRLLHFFIIYILDCWLWNWS